MLDKNSEVILNYLFKECSNNYKVIDVEDLIKLFSKKSHVDYNMIKTSVDYLDKSDYINVKYSDIEVFCVTVLPFGRQYIEIEKNEQQKVKKYNKYIILIFIGIFFCAILGGFLGTLIYSLL